MITKRWFRILFPISVILLSMVAACDHLDVEKAAPPLIVAKPKGCVDPVNFYVDTSGRANNPLLQIQCKEASGRITVYLRSVQDSVWTTYTLRPDLEEK